MTSYVATLTKLEAELREIYKSGNPEYSHAVAMGLDLAADRIRTIIEEAGK